MQHRQQRGGLERRTVVAMEDELVSQGGNAFGQMVRRTRWAAVFSRIGLYDFPADDLVGCRDRGSRCR